VAYRLLYANQGSIRNLPLKPELASIYQRAAEKAGIDAIRVISGGQEATGPHRTGSHRHDLGGAGDIQLISGGRPLDFTNKDDLPRITSFLQASKELGAAGIGAGSNYMGNTTYHVGFGTPGVWGGEGKGANAPAWLVNALGGVKPGSVGTTLTTSPVVASAAPAAPAAPGTASDPMAAAMKLIQQGIGGGSAPAEAAAPQQSVGAPVSAGSGGEDLSAGAATLMSALMDSRRKRYGLSLMG
jgi:hypothetical protein